MREQDVRHPTCPDLRPRDRFPSMDEISAHVRQGQRLRAQMIRGVVRQSPARLRRAAVSALSRWLHRQAATSPGR